MSDRSVYKFVLGQPVTEVVMPSGAVILDTEAQSGIPCVWAEVDRSARMEVRTFIVVPTGATVEQGTTYVGTIHGVDGWMVFHIYERLSR